MGLIAGAILGALSRYYISLWWTHQKGNRFPYGTLFINLTGAFLVGLLFVFVQTYASIDKISLFWFIGFLGSYTTFSSYIFDSDKLSKNGDSVAFWGYWLGSPVLGLAAVKLGILLAMVFIQVIF